ncbi:MULTISPECIES: hypothetical protein [unclassified Frankia]|nr:MULTISPECIES: hypothetical protein [unclassified Frankia]
MSTRLWLAGRGRWWRLGPLPELLGGQIESVVATLGSVDAGLGQAVSGLG